MTLRAIHVALLREIFYITRLKVIAGRCSLRINRVSVVSRIGNQNDC